MTHVKPARLIIFSFITLLLVSPLLKAWAMDSVAPLTKAPEKLTLIAGKSLIIRGSRPFTQISAPAEEIATAQALTEREIHLRGKKPGVTNMMLWQGESIVAVYDIEVKFDTTRLKQALYESLPGEENITVTAANDTITLQGRVSSQEKMTTAIALAESFLPKGETDDDETGVVNRLSVGGIHQVMLEVRVVEMSKTTAKRLGINFGYETGDSVGITLLNGLTGIVDPRSAYYLNGPIGMVTSPAINALFRFSTGGITWTGIVDALKEDGLVKILAEPTLMALSGQQATFLAGGEFPIPVPSNFGTIGIEFKEFGVGLDFTPTVLDQNKINIIVATEVSELDFSIALQLAGYTIPGLDTRKASTVIELGDGQSFAIAGLLSESTRANIKKYPLLGDIPILGVLFRSKQFQKNETELVIIATPHFVKPLDMAKQTLPTDYYIEPNNVEFYLEGMIQGRGDRPGAAVGVELDGQFGHVMPGDEKLLKPAK